MVTHHKPIERVFDKPTHTSSIQVQRRLVEYRPGKENISDYTSRHPMPISECSKFKLRTAKEVQHYVNYVGSDGLPAEVYNKSVLERH